jgi:hypothetical protein
MDIVEELPQVGITVGVVDKFVLNTTSLLNGFKPCVKLLWGTDGRR